MASQILTIQGVEEDSDDSECENSVVTVRPRLGRRTGSNWAKLRTYSCKKTAVAEIKLRNQFWKR